MTQPRTWYRVDNAGRIFSSVSDRRVTTLFRLAATLREPVHAGRLQQALDNLMPRFPYYAVQLRAGFFWYYFEENGERPQVTADSRYPCLNFAYRRRGSFPFRVRVWNRRIAIEMAHALTDGTGALTFLRSLVAEYLRLGGIVPHEPDGLHIPGDTPDPEEFEDAFDKYYNPDIPPAPPEEPAFHLPYDLEPAGIYHVITGVIPVKAALAAAKERQVSLTELLISVYLQSFQHALHIMPPRTRRKLTRPIRLDIPVNLRPLFPSKTMRNFFLPVYPHIDPRLGDFTFDEILRKVHHFMQGGIDPKYLAQQIARNVAAERSWLNRLIPLPVKNRVLSFTYDRYAQIRTTSGLSNLGLVKLPPPLDQAVERFEFLPAPPTVRRIACGVVSYGDSLFITFGRTVREPIVEECFFRWFTQHDIPVKLETNEAW